MVDEILAWVGNAIAGIISALYDGVSAILDWIVALVQGIGQVLWDALTTMFAIVSDGLALIFAGVEDFLNNLVEGVWQFLSNAWDQIQASTIGVLDTITNYVSDLWATLEAFVGQALDTVVSWIEDATDYIKNLVDAGIQWVADVGSTAVAAVTGVAEQAVGQAAAIIAQIQAALNAAWEWLIGGVDAVIAQLEQRLVGLKEAFAEAATEVVAGIGDLAEENLGPIRDTIREFVAAYLPTEDPAATQRAMVALEGIHTDPQSMAGYRAWWANEARTLVEAGPVKKGIYLTVFFLFSLIPTVMGISQVLSQPVIQEYSRQFPYQILSPADATAAWRRGLVTQDEAIGEIRRAGFDQRKAGFIAGLTSLAPEHTDLVRMLWRGIIHEADFDKALQHQGYDPPWQARFREAAKVIPAVPDLMQMAVRDVWNPAAVQIGQLEELFPDELAEWTKRQGLSTDWALKYWAAHWRLPSILQAFEMRHRDVIGDVELDTLLQALDVAPGWRQPLIDIAFHPYTRVDVRRMHRIGVLTEEQVHRAYLDLGYDAEKSRGLTDFTLALNEPKGIEDDEELGKLSRTAVLGFYEDGLLTRERAQELLIQQGHTPEAATLYLNSVDASDERSQRRTETDLVIELAEAGALGWDEAEDRLRGLGLETQEVERAVTRLLRAQQRKTKLPSKADADNFYLAGLVQKGEYLDLLGRLGYSPKWAQMYLQLAEVKRAKA